MEEKILLQISDYFGKGAVPVEFEKLPKRVREQVGGNTYSAFKYSEKDKSLVITRLVYFRKVNKFRKGITEIDIKDNITIGV